MDEAKGVTVTLAGGVYDLRSIDSIDGKLESSYSLGPPPAYENDEDVNDEARLFALSELRRACLAGREEESLQQLEEEEEEFTDEERFEAVAYVRKMADALSLICTFSQRHALWSAFKILKEHMLKAHTRSLWVEASKIFFSLRLRFLQRYWLETWAKMTRTKNREISSLRLSLLAWRQVCIEEKMNTKTTWALRRWHSRTLLRPQRRDNTSLIKKVNSFHRQCLMSTGLQRWSVWQRERKVVRKARFEAVRRRSIVLRQRCLWHWRIMVEERKSKSVALFIARQSKILRRAFTGWRQTSTDIIHLRAQLAAALHLWARTLEKRCFSILRDYAVSSRRKRLEAEAAFEKRRTALQRQGCARFLEAADNSKRIRDKKENRLAAARALRDVDLARKYATIWREKARRSAAQRHFIHTSPKVLTPPTPSAYTPTATRLLAAARPPRRQPRTLGNSHAESLEAEREMSTVSELLPIPAKASTQTSAAVQTGDATVVANDLVPLPISPPAASSTGVQTLPSTKDVATETCLSESEDVSVKKNQSAATNTAVQVAAPSENETSIEDIKTIVADAVRNAVSALQPAPNDNEKLQRRRKRIAAIRDLEAQLQGWQRQKRAWLVALREARQGQDMTFFLQLRREYRSWRRDLAPRLQACRAHLAVALRTAELNQVCSRPPSLLDGGIFMEDCDDDLVSLSSSIHPTSATVYF